MSVVENPAPPPKRRGRPPKKDRKLAAHSGETSLYVYKKEVNVSADGARPHNKRGRKSKAELAAMASSKESQSPNDEESTSMSSPSSEKRRRPSAYSYAEYSDASDGSDDKMPAVKSPEMSPKTPSTFPSGKRRGRPPKSQKNV
ncbi:unnamed protein product [Strongylus vulgaris]|uniref:Uncharacterized protein n=1 Tax=Strongylus vulgaris TaxID=40348 RepID=A0A3P7JAN4_STRVU|nr:unnamed protein product [Strongylus vulgaris]